MQCSQVGTDISRLCRLNSENMINGNPIVDKENTKCGLFMDGLYSLAFSKQWDFLKNGIKFIGIFPQITTGCLFFKSLPHFPYTDLLLTT